jgi:hypothetical protein
MAYYQIKREVTLWRERCDEAAKELLDSEGTPPAQPPLPNLPPSFPSQQPRSYAQKRVATVNAFLKSCPQDAVQFRSFAQTLSILFRDKISHPAQATNRGLSAQMYVNADSFIVCLVFAVRSSSLAYH